MSALNVAAPFVFVAALAIVQAVARRRRKAPRRAASVQTAAGTPALATSAAVPVAAAPRVPKRTPPQRTLPQPAAAPPSPAPPRRRGPAVAASPSWAANAIVAAEIFGPPVAQRPGGTLGPPAAF